MDDFRIILSLIGLFVLGVVVFVSYRYRHQEEIKQRRSRFRQRYNAQKNDDTKSTLLINDPEIALESTSIDVDEREALLEVQTEQQQPESEEVAVVPEPDVSTRPSRNDEPEPVVDQGDEQEITAEALSDSTLVIDFGAELLGDEPVDGATLVSLYGQNEYLLDKPHRLMGRQLPDGQWRTIDTTNPAGEYSDLAISVQLADSNGPMNDSALTRFSMLVLRLSESLDRKFRFSAELAEAEALAIALDQFLRQFDTIAILHVIARTPEGFSGHLIDDLLHRRGLILGDRNIYEHPAAKKGHPPLYSIANKIKPGTFDVNQMQKIRTHGLTLFMKMPLVLDPIAAFSEMATTAEVIAETLHGKLIDQQKSQISTAGINAIKDEIGKLADQMREAGMEPGGSDAIRLFS